MIAMFGLLLVGVLGAGLYLKGQIEHGIETIADPFAGLPTRAPESALSPSGGRPVNILLLGSDSRISAGDPTQWRFGAQRTDSIMLLHITGDRDGAYVVSIPRDSWVPIPGRGTAKINAAFSYGGPPLMIQTVEELTGVRIDHFAVADFQSFADLTDAVGGVTITIPADTYAHGERVMTAGTQVLDGEQALAYARQRYGLPGGDFDRIKRQQNWVRAMADSALSRGTLTNPVEAWRLIRTLTRSVAVDEGFSTSDMISLALDMREVRPDDVEFVTVPVLGTGWSPDGTQSIVRLDRQAMGSLTRAIARDRVAQYLADESDAVEVLGDRVR